MRSLRPAFSTYARSLEPAPMDLGGAPYLPTVRIMRDAEARVARIAALDLHVLVSAGRMARAIEAGRPVTARAASEAMRAAMRLRRARIGGCA